MCREQGITLPPDDRKVERNPKSDTDDVDESTPDRRPSEEDQERLASERLEEVQQYFKDRLSRREIVTVTETPMGQLLDWVPIESLVHDGKVADPPAEDGIDLRSLDQIPAEVSRRFARLSWCRSS
jgi:hypothetical protein